MVTKVTRVTRKSTIGIRLKKEATIKTTIQVCCDSESNAVEQITQLTIFDQI